jgi:hypothetical protein
MPENRYVSFSERSVMILEGALLYGRYMNTSPSSPNSETLYKAWLDWSEGKEKMADAARKLQGKAFDLASLF